nr:MAG TPA: SecE/Sec61-gamma subunits of protein translocation complex [Caudoviricetes sp.]
MPRSWTTCKRRWKTENWRTQTPYKVILCGVFLYLFDSIICNVLALLFA